MARVVVIGGGVAGLTSAYGLRGHDVTVVEGTSVIGGKLRTSQIAGVDVDEGAEQLLTRVPEGVDLVSELRLAGRLVHPVTSSASVWTGGRLRPLPQRTVMGVPSSISSLRSVLPATALVRAAADYVLPAGDCDDDESVAAHIGRRLGAAVVDRLVDPLLGGVYAGRAEGLSMRATLPQLAMVHGSLVRGVRRSLPPPSDAPVFAGLVGGLQQVADEIARQSTATIVTGRLVRRVEKADTGFRVIHGPTTDEQVLLADAVVVATPPPSAARLLADLAPAAAAELAGIEMASMAIVTLAWPRDLLPALSGSGYLVPAVERRPVKAVTFSSYKWSHLADSGIAVVRCSIGRHGDVSVLQRDDAELAALAVAELAEHLGVTAVPIESRVSRWGGGLPQYAVGHVDRVRRLRAAVDAVPGLAVCGAAYEGVGVPACVRSGREAAARILSAI